MKPHFIFNTLNSINNYIISNEAISASRYLTKFSALIRKIMDYAQYESINLDEELNTLELYMKIEALRLKQKFDYTIAVNENVDRHNTHLPGLILQPFVENSIWHGIQPLDRKGIIKIKVSKKEVT
ncbi:MAG: histidine kinase [Chloroflexia bacterium]|nr:histidine kinase [Chloroflexia bacterium]